MNRKTSKFVLIVMFLTKLCIPKHWHYDSLNFRLLFVCKIYEKNIEIVTV